MVQIGDDTVGVRIAVRDTAIPRGSQIYNWGIKKAGAPVDGDGRGESRISSDVSLGTPIVSIVPQSEPTDKPENRTNGEVLSVERESNRPAALNAQNGEISADRKATRQKIRLVFGRNLKYNI